MRKKILHLANTELANEFDRIVKNIKSIRKQLTDHTKIQISFETWFQLFATNFMLFYSDSRTKTKQDILYGFFQQEDHVFMGITMSSKTIIYFLFLFNIFSLLFSYYREIVKGYVCNYSIIGKLAAMLCILCNCTIRIMSLILFYAPVFGLFDLLHHYQGKYNIDIRIQIYFKCKKQKPYATLQQCVLPSHCLLTAVVLIEAETGI